MARAEGILTQLYGLGEPIQARRLLQTAAHRHEVAVRMLAAPIVDTWWQPHPPASMPTLPPPELPLIAAPATDPGIPGLVLARGLELSDGQQGDVQLVNPATDRLVLTALHGLPPTFAACFAEVDTDGTACAHARNLARRVDVADVATCPLFTPTARQSMLHAGSRAVHSIPWISHDGDRLGMFSLHAPRPGHHLTRAEGNALDTLAAEAARWALWHRASSVHDALNDLDTSARAPS